ncbi:hypothetical protein ACFLZD_00290 [Candidatus Neomarinimicrobiota bacterium]
MISASNQSSSLKRSTNIIYDIDNNLLLNNLIVTKPLEKTISLIKYTLESKSSDSALSVVGPYGSGKSTTIIAVVRYLLQNLPTAVFKDFKTQKLNYLSQKIPLDDIKMIVGEREPIKKAISKVLGVRGNIVKQLKKKFNSDKNYRCVLIIDEFGKYLEYLSDNPSSGDVYILQELAELAHNLNGRFILITVRHQAIKAYFNKANGNTLSEWKKIQGRFSEIVHSNTISESLEILHSHFIKQFSKIKIVPKEILDSLKTNNILNRNIVESFLSDIYPLNPFTAIILISAFKKFAQNERSIFTFLSSNEPFGYNYHLKNNKSAYEISDFYDYIKYNLESTMLESEFSNQWSMIATTLSLLESKIDEKNGWEFDKIAKTIKTIGLLNIFGKDVNIFSTKEVLKRANYSDYRHNNNITKTLKTLENQLNLISYRKLFSTYHLWHGSDLNINNLVNQKVDEIRDSINFSKELNTHFRLEHIIARKLLIETGSVRYMSCHFLNKNDFDNRETSEADGRIHFLISRNNNTESIESIRRKIDAPNESFVNMIISKSFEELLINFTSISRILVENQSLVKDKIARNELLSLQEYYKEQIEDDFRNLSKNNVKLLLLRTAGIPRKIKWNDLNEIASEKLATYYKLSPVIKNELINHDTVSPNVKVSLYKLYYYIVEYPHKLNIGIEGNGPEYSIYLNVLKATGIHRKSSSQFKIMKPNSKDLGIQSTWELLISKIENTASDKRVSLLELEEMLSEEPYGIKRFLGKILIIACISSRLEHLSIYHRNSFVPKIYRDTAERMLRNPQDFEIQFIPQSGIHQSLFNRISEQLFDSQKDMISLLDIVVQLVQFVNRLPKYTKRTQSLSELSRNVLSTVLNSQSPEELIYKSLPIALNLSYPEDFKQSNLEYAEYIETYTNRLSNAIDEIRDKRNNLFRECVMLFSNVWGYNESDPELLREKVVSEIPPTVFEVISDEKLRAFANRMLDSNVKDTNWFESIASLLANKPMDNWIDTDTQIYIQELKHRVRQIRELQKISSVVINANLKDEDIILTEESINDYINSLKLSKGQALAAISRIYTKLIKELEG